MALNYAWRPLYFAETPLYFVSVAAGTEAAFYDVAGLHLFYHTHAAFGLPSSVGVVQRRHAEFAVGVDSGCCARGGGLGGGSESAERPNSAVGQLEGDVEASNVDQPLPDNFVAR